MVMVSTGLHIYIFGGHHQGVCGGVALMWLVGVREVAEYLQSKE